MIGRELYTSPFIWIKPPNCTIEEDSGRCKCFDRFEVLEVGYNEHREINHLRVINSKTHNVVYSYDVSESSADDPVIKPGAECERCGKIITGGITATGETLAAHEIIGRSKIAFNGVYCLDCQAALAEKKPADKKAENAKVTRNPATEEQKAYIRDNANDEDYEAIMRKYGVELERLTEAMAAKCIKTIDEHNKQAG